MFMFMCRRAARATRHRNVAAAASSDATPVAHVRAHRQRALKCCRLAGQRWWQSAWPCPACKGRKVGYSWVLCHVVVSCSAVPCGHNFAPLHAHLQIQGMHAASVPALARVYQLTAVPPCMGTTRQLPCQAAHRASSATLSTECPVHIHMRLMRISTHQHGLWALLWLCRHAGKEHSTQVHEGMRPTSDEAR